MSALVAIRTANAIYVLSDAASTSIRNDDTYGMMLRTHAKQVIAPDGVVFACCCYFDPTLRFAELAAQQCAGYDGVVLSAEDFLTEAVKTLGRWQDQFCGVFYCGWSERAKRLRMDITFSDPIHGIWSNADAKVLAIGPAPPARELGDTFVKRFADDPDSFNPRRDGLALIEDMRRQCRCEDYGRSYFAIGGCVQLTIVTPGEIKTGIVHHWPDEMGKRIEPGAEVGAVTSSGTPWRDVYRRREEALIEQQADFLARAKLRRVPVRDGTMTVNPSWQRGRGVAAHTPSTANGV